MCECWVKNDISASLYDSVMRRIGGISLWGQFKLERLPGLEKAFYILSIVSKVSEASAEGLDTGARGARMHPPLNWALQVVPRTRVRPRSKASWKRLIVGFLLSVQV